jgi:hypothetical protein
MFEQNEVNMKTETRKIYTCDYCPKHYKVASRCKYHERICTKNPENQRACYGCGHLIKRAVTVDAGWVHPFGGDGERTVSVLFCQKLNVMIHTPQNAIRGNQFEHAEYKNVEMLKECSERIDEKWEIEEPAGMHIL